MNGCLTPSPLFRCLFAAGLGLAAAGPAVAAAGTKVHTANSPAEAVPALAPLLTNEHLASWARIALEAIPGPEAGAALREAAEGAVHDRREIGIVLAIHQPVRVIREVLADDVILVARSGYRDQSIEQHIIGGESVGLADLQHPE